MNLNMYIDFFNELKAVVYLIQKWLQINRRFNNSEDVYSLILDVSIGYQYTVEY